MTFHPREHNSLARAKPTPDVEPVIMVQLPPSACDGLGILDPWIEEAMNAPARRKDCMTPSSFRAIFVNVNKLSQLISISVHGLFLPGEQRLGQQLGGGWVGDPCSIKARERIHQDGSHRQIIYSQGC